MILGYSITTPLTSYYWPTNWILSVLYCMGLKSITKMCITIIILMFIIGIAIVVIIGIIIVIIISITVITKLWPYSLNSHGGYIKSNNYFLQVLRHMTCDIKFSHMYFLFTFPLFKSYNILWIKIICAI